VALTLYDGSYDEALAAFVAERQQAGQRFDLDELLLLSYLREHSEIDLRLATGLLQRSESATRDTLERLALQPETWLERRGMKKGVTYHLAQNAAVALQGSVVYTRSRDIDAVRWPEMIRAYVARHGSINNTECRQLLGLGNSDSARTQTTRLLRAMDFLDAYGTTRQNMRYRLRQSPGA